MAILKKETTDQGQVAAYHKILSCEFDAKYRQFHVTIGSYAGQKYRDTEKGEEQEKEEQLRELNAFRAQLSEKISQIEAELPGLRARDGKLRDKIDDILQETNLIDSEDVEQEKQERQEPLILELEELTAQINELYEERESLLVQDTKAMESIQAWAAQMPTARCMYLTTYTLSQDQTEAVNKILDLIYPEVMKLEPFEGSKKI